MARAKRRKLIRVSPEYLTRLDDAFQATSRSRSKPKLPSVVAACGSENNFVDNRAFRKKHNIESAQILALKKKGLVEEIEEVDGTTAASAPHSEISLSGHQSTALAQIEEGFAAGKPTPFTRGNRLWKNRFI